MAAVALCAAAGALAYHDATDPVVARASLFTTESGVRGTGGPFPGAEVRVGSYCRPGKRDKMQARLYWTTSGDKVGSALLWLEAPDGSARLVASEVLETPRASGVVAGAGHQTNGPWVRARLELFAGAADYAADKTTIEIDCVP
jgi:hypothetical protein